MKQGLVGKKGSTPAMQKEIEPRHLAYKRRKDIGGILRGGEKGFSNERQKKGGKDSRGTKGARYLLTNASSRRESSGGWGTSY